MKRTRELQNEVYGRDLWNMTGRDRAQAITNDYAETVVELGEAMQEFPGHKTWVTDRDKLDREKFIVEIVDALHFVGNMLIAVQCTDEELSAQYSKKMQLNRMRQESGNYDGVKDR